jgi:hypothetical protein
MKVLRIALLLAAVITIAARGTLAHHSFAAEYDRDKPITLSGTISKVEWQNPHVYFYIDVKGGDGKMENWAIEAGAPNTLYRAGWRKDWLEVGREVTVDAWLAKSGAKLANLRSMVLPDGRRVTGASSAGNGN